MPDQTSPKVLIVAANASSKFGGEAFLPLRYYQILRRRGHDATLITHARNRDDLNIYLEPFKDDILYVEDTVWHRLAWKICRPLPSKIRDVVSELLMKIAGSRSEARIIRGLIKEGRINLIHQPTPVSPRSPSAMHRFGLPLIIGPMNGGMSYPDGYDDFEPATTRYFVRIGRGFATIANRLIPGKRKADLLLVANARTRKALPVSEHPNVIELVENGIDLETWKAPEIRPLRSVEEPFRLVFMGRLVDWKAVNVTLNALERARRTGLDVRLDILGDGPMRDELTGLTRTLGLNDAVTFHGFLPQSECAGYLDKADALVLNSVCECGGAVVLEAMSLALPVIALDWGGPADYLDESCGILLSPAPRATLAERIGNAIEQLARSPQTCQRLGQSGAEKILRDYDWEKKVDQMVGYYNDVLRARQK